MTSIHGDAIGQLDTLLLSALDAKSMESAYTKYSLMGITPVCTYTSFSVVLVKC